MVIPNRFRLVNQAVISPLGKSVTVICFRGHFLCKYAIVNNNQRNTLPSIGRTFQKAPDRSDKFLNLPEVWNVTEYARNLLPSSTRIWKVFKSSLARSRSFSQPKGI